MIKLSVLLLFVIFVSACATNDSRTDKEIWATRFPSAWKTVTK